MRTMMIFLLLFEAKAQKQSQCKEQWKQNVSRTTNFETCIQKRKRKKKRRYKKAIISSRSGYAYNISMQNILENCQALCGLWKLLEKVKHEKKKSKLIK